MDVEEDGMTIVRNAMITDLVCNDRITFKSQQIGEPDLSVDEKRNIAEDCLKNKPLCFLSKFSPYMKPSHFEYIRKIHPEFDYEIGHYQQENSACSSQVLVKNRRLEALKRLALEGDYFTEEEMRKRNPLLYEQLVGKYLTEDEKKNKESFTHTMQKEDGCKLSSLLMEQFERDLAANLRQEQENAEEELDSESEDDLPHGKPKEKDDRVLHLWGESNSASNYIDVSDKITEGEKRLLFEEFRSHMYRDFIGGRESDFDYSLIDTNADYDDLDELDRDAQDKYFDSDDPEDVDMEDFKTTNGVVIQNDSNQTSDMTTDGFHQNNIINPCDAQIEESTHVETVGKSSTISVANMLSCEDDPLDLYTSQLEEELSQQQLNSQMKNTAIG